MTTFVTVGSTRFDKLIKTIFTNDVISSLLYVGLNRLIIQYGETCKPIIPTNENIQISMFSYKDTLYQDMKEATLIISHAGSGSILEALEMKKKLIVVVNTDLMDNHQIELAMELEKQNYLIMATTENLGQVIREKHYNKCVEFPRGNSSIFRDIVDEEMGFHE